MCELMTEFDVLGPQSKLWLCRGALPETSPWQAMSEGINRGSILLSPQRFARLKHRDNSRPQRSLTIEMLS